MSARATAGAAPILALAAACVAVAVVHLEAEPRRGRAPAGQAGRVPDDRAPRAGRIPDAAAERFARDLRAMERYRPAYRFWRHVFTLADGAIAFGSAADGRLVATFPVTGEWSRDAVWEDGSLAWLLDGRALPEDLTARRHETAAAIAPSVGPVVHNPTRGLFVLPNARRYGAFLGEWAAIYERFAVPGEIGLAQALVESGFSGTARSEARAAGFCQWLPVNWNRIRRLSPHVLESDNQTTQAPYCAAHLSILATKYGSFIPALSEHHTGGANIGRTLINGERLGGADVRERYFLGAEFARDLRARSPGTYADVYGTYGPRSYLYAEMIFGNMATVASLVAGTPQSRIVATRTTGAVTLAEVVRRTGLTAEEIRRYNPALRARVPAGATLYLPRHIPSLGRDVSFWHRPAPPAYAAVLEAFVRLQPTVEAWDGAGFDSVLTGFRRRFEATGTEEGRVMATTLAYVLEDRHASRQPQIVAEFRTSPRIQALFERARLEREAGAAPASDPAALD